jgi:hypothetical protein
VFAGFLTSRCNGGSTAAMSHIHGYPAFMLCSYQKHRPASFTVRRPGAPIPSCVASSAVPLQQGVVIPLGFLMMSWCPAQQVQQAVQARSDLCSVVRYVSRTVISHWFACSGSSYLVLGSTGLPSTGM